MNVQELAAKINGTDRRTLARCISLIENDSDDAVELLKILKIDDKVPVVGITGPPGAGKSTLLNALISEAIKKHPECNIAVLAVDPTSPFTHGSLLGDRLRMTEHFNDPRIYIRSLATRGALGGLSAKTIEITDLLKSAGFNYIFIETVGVGQSEVEIASLADVTLVVFVPESGDEIQTIKSGIMEIADIFVVNKSDREGADQMVKNLTVTLHERPSQVVEIKVIKTVASSQKGTEALFNLIEQQHELTKKSHSGSNLLYIKALKLTQNYLLRKIDQDKFRTELLIASKKEGFNLYNFVAEQVK